MAEAGVTMWREVLAAVATIALAVFVAWVMVTGTLP